MLPSSLSPGIVLKVVHESAVQPDPVIDVVTPFNDTH